MDHRISDGEIEKILEIYRPEHRYVYDAILAGSELKCALKPTVYPYTQSEIFEYITAPTATLYSCQLCYVLVGAIARRGFADSFNWEEFLRQRNTAALRFTSLDFRFRAEVCNSGRIAASIRFGRIRNLAGIVHCVMEFEIANGIHGRIQGVLTRT
jgi:hypothetical protein